MTASAVLLVKKGDGCLSKWRTFSDVELHVLEFLRLFIAQDLLSYTLPYFHAGRYLVLWETCWTPERAAHGVKSFSS